MKSIRRWWQSKGFGIQSRTDYEYLKNVLRQPLPYYAYKELQSEVARLIFRVCNHARNERVALVGDYSPEEKLAAQMALNGKSWTLLDSITHTHDIDTLIIKGIDNVNKEVWQTILRDRGITWDMQHIGIAQFPTGRYPERYEI